MDFTEFDKAEEWFNNSEHGKGRIAGFVPLLMAEYAEYYHQCKVKNLDIPRVINWVAVTERMPEEEWGDYMVCLENNAVFKANYSRIGTERWMIVGVGNITDTNPVKYWAELPEPPCL